MARRRKKPVEEVTSSPDEVAEPLQPSDPEIDMGAAHEEIEKPQAPAVKVSRKSESAYESHPKFDKFKRGN